jgi:hypothetical protein
VSADILTYLALLKGRTSKVDLLVPTSSDQLLFTLKKYFSFFYKTVYLNKEVKCTEPFPFSKASLLQATKAVKEVQSTHPFNLQNRWVNVYITSSGNI